MRTGRELGREMKNKLLAVQVDLLMMTESVEFAAARYSGYCCCSRRIDCIAVCRLQAQCPARGQNNSRAGER